MSVTLKHIVILCLWHINYRQREDKLCAVADFALHPDFAAVCFYRETAERQPQADTLRHILIFHAAELIKHTVLHIFWDAGSTVLDADQCAIFSGARANANCAASRGIFDGVLNQVSDDADYHVSIGF